MVFHCAPAAPAKRFTLRERVELYGCGAPAGLVTGESLEGPVCD